MQIFRGYLLLCQHIWQFLLMSEVITTYDWTEWASIFGDDGGFEFTRLPLKLTQLMRYTV